MKIAIPVKDNTLKSGVSPNYGRAPYYFIYDGNSEEGSFVANPAASESGGAGVRAAQFLIDQGVEVLLTPRLGDHAAEVLMEAQIQLYQTRKEGLEVNLYAFLMGHLPSLDEISGRRP